MSKPRKRRTQGQALDADAARLTRAASSNRRSGYVAGSKDAVRFVGDTKAIAQLLEGDNGPVAKLLLQRAMQVQRAAKRLCPVDTGRLRASIQYRMGTEDRGLYAEVGTNVDYAAFVELGTSNQAPRPFLRPALNDVFRSSNRGSSTTALDADGVGP